MVALRAFALAVGLLSCASPALAAGPWSAPKDLGPPADYVSSPKVVFEPSGLGLMSWLVRAQPAAGGFSVLDMVDRGGYASRFARVYRDDRPGAAALLPGKVVAGPALDRSGRGLILRSRVVSRDPDGRSRESVSWSTIIRTNLVFRANHLFSAILGGSPALAVDARGDAIVAWSEYRPPASTGALDGTYRIRAAWRPAGRASFDRPATLLVAQARESEHNGAVTAAIGRDGRAIVVFADVHQTRRGVRRNVLAWTRTPRRGFGRSLTVGPHAGFAEVAAAVSDRGRAIVAWGTQDGGEEANGPWVVRTATLARGALRFSPAQTLDAGAGINRPQSGLSLALAADGRATAAWSAVRVSPPPELLRFPVMTARSDARGHFAPAQQIAPSGAVGGVAVRADGAAIVTWANVLRDQVTDQAMAAVRAARASTFGAPEAIAAPDVADPPTAAFNPLTGRPTAVWPARPGGTQPSYGVARTAVLRVALRAAP